MRVLIFLVAFLSVMITLQAQDYSDYTGCAEQDSLALVAFYHATGGPDWACNQDGFSIDNLSDDVLTYHSTDYPNAGLGKWLEGPVKDWFGVLLEKQLADNGQDYVWRVVHLRPTISRRSAGDNNLSGYIPQEVGMLTALEWFKVNGNVGLGGTEVPDEVFQPSLEELDLEAVYFTGVVSDALRNCTGLKFTNLRYNYFDSIPLCDFYAEDLELEKTVFFYNNQISYATLEPTIEYFVERGILYEARKNTDVGRAQEIVVAEGDPVTLTCNEAGVNGTYTWYKKGFNTYMPGSTFNIASVTPADTGNYTVLIDNEFIRVNDENSDYNNSFTKPIHLTFTPSTPLLKKATGAEDGKSIELEFSKPMGLPHEGQQDDFTVSCGDESIDVERLTREGRLADRLTLQLTKSLTMGENISVIYTPGSVVCANGGILESFEVSAENRTGTSPTLLSAVTRTDGNGIELTFDYYIDINKLDVQNLSVQPSSPVNISSIQTINGDVNNHITKKLLISVDQAFIYSDDISVSLSAEAVFALYGAGNVEITNFPVENKVIAERTPVKLTVIDGTAQIQNLVIKGNLSTEDVLLKDDGSQGDEISGDNTWSVQMELTEGDYEWNAYKRATEVRYDTVWVDLGNGQKAMQLNPYLHDTDSLLTEEVILNFSVSTDAYTGETSFGYMNKTLTLILDLNGYLNNNPGETADPYVMGIDGDWSEGIALNPTDETHIFSVQFEGYGYGEEVNYSFRNGNVWENSNLDLRQVVMNDDLTVEAAFGDFYNTAVDKVHYIDKCFDIWPNPVENYLNLSVCNSLSNLRIQIVNMSGQVVFKEVGNMEQINLSSLRSGIYILHVLQNSTTFSTAKFIKK